MSSCEKCWRDSGGDSIAYGILIDQRKDHPCTPEQQAGNGHFCGFCMRQTIHMYTGECMNPNCSSHGHKQEAK